MAAGRDRGEQYAISANPAQPRGVSHKQLGFPPSQQRQFVGIPDKRTFYLSKVKPAAVLGEIDRLFSKGCFRKLERFAVGQRFEPDLARVHRISETTGAAEKRHQLPVARYHGNFSGIIKVRKLPPTQGGRPGALAAGETLPEKQGCGDQSANRDTANPQ